MTLSDYQSGIYLFCYASPKHQIKMISEGQWVSHERLPPETCPNVGEKLLCALSSHMRRTYEYGLLAN